MAVDIKNGNVSEDEISEEAFGNYLDTVGIPDPDLLIRTSGEQRLSNYLLWQLAYTEFYFTDVLWPDFSKKDLERLWKSSVFERYVFLNDWSCSERIQYICDENGHTVYKAG